MFPKAKLPTVGAYLVFHNCETNGYPWRECIKSALEISDKVYILEAGSSDKDVNAIYEAFGNVPNVVMKRCEDEWDMNDVAIVGKMKQRAREMVQEDYCLYLDADEVMLCRDKNALLELLLSNPDVPVFSTPYITFFGDGHHVANFKEAENFWRWKILKNIPEVGHGVHGAARKYDENGRMYMDKALSDGCEIINMNTLEVMPSLMYMPGEYFQIGSIYRQVPQGEDVKSKITTVFSEIANTFPLVCLHYGWVNFQKKAENALKYWTKTKAYKTGVEHSQLFDGLDSDQHIADSIKKWESIDRIKLNIKEHPPVMREYLHQSVKPKILSVSLASTGPFGVPKWGKMLESALDSYDVQRAAFNDYVTQVPQGALEFHKAESFMQFVKNHEVDKNAIVIFGDGFWAASYPGPAKVVSVVHGLWSHPLRDKWDDGLLEQRKALSQYQMAYYAKAKEMGHTLICVSPFIHKILKDEYEIDSILIPNSIDIDFYDNLPFNGVEKDRPLIIHGITSANKGGDILRAFETHPLIKDKFDVGRIDEVGELMNVPNEIVFKAADLAFLPTKWEASSYLLLECMANNLPFVAYRAGILHSDLPHQNECGVVLDEYDVDAFAQAVVDLYANLDNFRSGQKYLQTNQMTLPDWTSRMKRLVYEVL